MADRGYLEVETPMMQPLAGGAAARPFVTHHNALDIPLYLRIAPELYLKRLLVGGFTKVFELNRNFRNEGISPRHNPEFTMLEAYEAFGSWETMADLVEGMICHLAETLFGEPEDCSPRRHGGHGESINLQRPWRRVRMADLVEERTGWKIRQAAACRRANAGLSRWLDSLDGSSRSASDRSEDAATSDRARSIVRRWRTSSRQRVYLEQVRPSGATRRSLRKADRADV